jgi:hypothetical protein
VPKVRAFLFAGTATAVLLFSSVTAAVAAEQGVAIRAGDIKAEPFIDAATAASVAANQPVTILERRAGWVRVESGGKTGWMRMLNLRLAAGDVRKGGARPDSLAASAALFRTGSSGKTVATGVKGMGEEDIRSASVDLAQLDKLDGLAVDSAAAATNASGNGLKETQVAYLKGGRK